MFDTIKEQLQGYCDCVDFGQTAKEQEHVDKNLEELINFISTITCWRNKPCETFLLSEREEVFDMDAVFECGCCDSGLMVVDPFYDNIQEDSIKVKLLKRDGIKFEEIELDESLYSYNAYLDKLYIDLSEFASQYECSCDVIEKVIVSYIAGYEYLPDCVLPIFCDMLEYINDLNSCDCECNNCGSEEDGSVVELPGNDAQISAYIYIRDTITKSYSRQLEVMSLCGRGKHFMGMVI